MNTIEAKGRLERCVCEWRANQSIAQWPGEKSDEIEKIKIKQRINTQFILSISHPCRECIEFASFVYTRQHTYPITKFRRAIPTVNDECSNDVCLCENARMPKISILSQRLSCVWLRNSFTRSMAAVFAPRPQSLAPSHNHSFLYLHTSHLIHFVIVSLNNNTHLLPHVPLKRGIASKQWDCVYARAFEMHAIMFYNEFVFGSIGAHLPWNCSVFSKLITHFTIATIRSRHLLLT